MTPEERQERAKKLLRGIRLLDRNHEAEGVNFAHEFVNLVATALRDAEVAGWEGAYSHMFRWYHGSVGGDVQEAIAEIRKQAQRLREEP